MAGIQANEEMNQKLEELKEKMAKEKTAAINFEVKKALEEVEKEREATKEAEAKDLENSEEKGKQEE